MQRSYLISLIALLSLFAGYSQKTIEGVWKTVDDKSGLVKSHIEIYKRDGKVYGKVLKVLDPESPDNPICQNCEGRFKDQPIIGLEILWDLVKDGDNYEDGYVLDPEKGKKYDCKIWLDQDDPDKLKVRGYVMFLYRTQTWERL
ncbi:MAG: DUF2147 domain-containing protein [Nonlabens sp.]